MNALYGGWPEEPVGRFLDADRPVWNPQEDEILVCRQVREETRDVKTFVFSARTPCRFRYRPGQFLTLDLEIGGETIHRCYTISSTPTRPDMVSITVKRVPGGTVSNWLHDTLRPGASVRVSGPMGSFTCIDHPAPKYLFLSGGSGVTPLMSMARAFHDLAEPRDIAFVHAARTPADIIFRRELEMIADTDPAFAFTAICEADTPGARWGGLKGRLSGAMLALVAPDFMERTVLTCGPAPFMAAVRAMLAQAGFDMARYHEESFDFGTLAGEEEAPTAVPDYDPDAPAVRTFEVRFSRSGRTIACPADMPVLAAARMAGLRLASSCTKGMCGTCKSKLVEGSVEMHHQGGIRQREIDAGMVLLCCARPRADLVVDR